jgi:hypothetical protein
VTIAGRERRRQEDPHSEKMPIGVLVTDISEGHERRMGPLSGATILQVTRQILRTWLRTGRE